MMINRIKKLMTLIGWSVWLPVLAVEYTWSNTSTSEQSWQTAANWQKGGVESTTPPTNTYDVAILPDIDSTMRSVKLSIASDGTAGDIAAITGGKYWKLILSPSGGTYRDYTETFAVADVNDFTGTWSATGGKKTLKLTATKGEQQLQTVSVAGQFALEVANANVTADVVRLTGTCGSLKKCGAGELRVRSIPDKGNLVLELEEGDVQLDGIPRNPRSVALAALKKSTVWLDASEESTWKPYSYTDSEGRTRVTNWVDVAGRTLKAEIWDNSKDGTSTHIKTIEPPFISTRTSSTGLALMDFGTSKPETETTLPQALMRFSSRIAEAQEIFYVTEAASGAQILGDDTDYKLSSSIDYAFIYGESITNNGGFAYFNGSDTTPALTLVGTDSWRMARQIDAYTTTKQNALQLTNVGLGEGNAKPVHYLASDRLYKSAGSGTGGVRIGELLIFTNTLTSVERAEVTEYLMSKWFTRYNSNDFNIANVADATSITVPAGQIARIGTLRATGNTFMKKGAGTLQISRVFPETMKIEVAEGAVEITADVRTGTPSAPAGTPQLWLDANSSDAFVTSGDDVTAWNDCRDNGLKATKLGYEQITAYPYAESTRLSGKTVLTFPTSSGFQLPTESAQREIFIVGSYTETPAEYNLIAEGYRTDRKQNSVYYMFAAPGVGLEALAGGTFSVDGLPVRPYEPAESTFVKDQWYVLHLATPYGSQLARLASNGPRSRTGNVSYGEVIAYSTELTPAERAANIDYLMRKWQNQRNPEYAAPTGVTSVNYEDGAALEFDYEDGALDAVAAVGRVSFAGEVIVNLGGDDAAHLPFGSYTLMTATEGFSNVDFTKWKIYPTPERRTYRLEKVGNTIVLKSVSTGFFAIIH